MLKLLQVTAFIALFSSCAAFVTGTTDEIRVSSEPAGVYFRSNFGHLGTTPARIDVPCDEPLEITYFQPGYRDQKLRVDTQLSGWVWGNILSGFIGSIVDFAGPGFTHTHKAVHARLVPAPKKSPGVR